jgi:4-hydroxythreonine-4-phosphate dehydrogenase
VPLPLLLTPGDPRGIGPEVACRALSERAAQGAPVPAVLIGDRAALEKEAARFGLRLIPVAAVGEAVCGGIAHVDPGGSDEPVEVTSLRVAVAALRSRQGASLVTGPIHKARLAASGFPFSGHTDFLGHLCGVARPVMAFTGGRLTVALVTVHVPLRRVADAITIDLVLHVLRTCDAALRDQLRLGTRRLLVCGLNPHAGDGGVLGREELDVIAPAVEGARALGIDAVGPISAETAFRRAVDGGAEMVVAMYHDQGLAPLKLVDFGRSVNWTLGLPFVRTSVDHGTADDIAGRGVADAASMHAALRLAERLAGCA